MKNIYKILLFIPLITMLSCDDNEDYGDLKTKGTTTLENSVFIATDNLDDFIALAGLRTTKKISVGVNNVIATDVIVDFKVVLNGVLATLDEDYKMEKAVIEKEQYEGASAITFLKVGNYDVYVSNSTENSLKVVYNRLRYFVPENVTMTLNWEDSYYDYGLFVLENQTPLTDIYSNYNSDIHTLIGYSDGVSNSEMVNLSLPVGDSFVYLEDYWNDNADIPVVFSFQQGGQAEETIEIIMEKDKWAVKITTEFDGVDKVSYKIEAL
ncbi:MAG: hypothetical protein JKY08_00825 [Flavobacteriaceae bacterium]|nr:hypothetical protein [Flavobacteriaceae bacterium]